MLAALAAASLAPLAGAEPLARERRVQIEDLLLLRELGAGRSGLALSPDGDRLAVMERRTLLESNAYRYDLVVLDAREGAAPLVIGDGGGFILASDNGRRSGASVARTPVWSADGRFIAYLAERDGRAELWISSLDGRVRRAVAGDEADVRRFAWTPDDAHLVIETNTPRAALAASLREAMRDGFRADERFDPGYALRPAPDEAIGRRVWTVSLRTGARRLASADEHMVLDGAHLGGLARADVVTVDANTRAAAPELAVIRLGADGVRHDCPLPECRGDIVGAWLSAGGDEVFFQREEGPARDLNVFYAWRFAGEQSVRLVRRAEERMMDCALSGSRLFCLQEFATQPRRIAALDLSTGALAVVYDPNPAWRSVSLPRIERIDLPAGRYEASYAHLVYPNDYEPGRRYPLIVTQYRSRGFLRWGTGAQLPIFAAAARGYFVLSLERPEARALERRLSYDEVGTRTELDGSERAMKLDQLDRLLALLVERGLIDPAQVALTGMSDGAETLYAAISRDRAYAAASVGSQPIDALNWQLASQAFQRVLSEERGLSPPWAATHDPWGRWWRDNIVVNNAERIATPLMFHLSETEALNAFPLIVRLRELGIPSEVYLYPGAYHLKWRPRQILAMQQRTLDWIDFWTAGRVEHLATADAERWGEMRRTWRARQRAAVQAR